METYTVAPEDVGLKRAVLDDIRGGATPEESAAQVRAVLSGDPGARLDMVLLNGGAALMASGRSVDLAAGVELARKIVHSGAALEKLDNLVGFCRQK